MPARLQEPLLSGVAALAEQAPVCVPTVPAETTEPEAQSRPAPTAGHAAKTKKPKHGRAKGKAHGHGKAKGKKK